MSARAIDFTDPSIRVHRAGNNATSSALMIDAMDILCIDRFSSFCLVSRPQMARPNFTYKQTSKGRAVYLYQQA
jgi:hypothetical protein